MKYLIGLLGNTLWLRNGMVVFTLFLEAEFFLQVPLRPAEQLTKGVKAELLWLTWEETQIPSAKLSPSSLTCPFLSASDSGPESRGSRKCNLKTTGI